MILKQLRRIHLVVGLATFLIFLMTGVALWLMFPGVYHANESIRYLYRASHVYILFAGLLNLVLGAYVSPSEAPGRRVAQLIGSVLLLAAPLVLIWAFSVEPARGVPSRPITLAGVILCLGGAGLHLLARPSYESAPGQAGVKAGASPGTSAGS